MVTRRGGAGPFVNPSPTPRRGGAGPFVNPPIEKKEIKVSGANIAPNNIFKKVGTNNNMPIFKANMPDRPSDAVLASQAQNANVDNTKSEGFFKKADPTPMNQLVKPSYLVGSPTVEKGLSQYDALTNLTKMREMSLSGKLKGLAPVYEEGTGRIINFEPSNAYQYIVPGYDLDGVAFSEKQSAMRTGIDPKAYQAMGLGERASHLGTEVKSMGSELGTGFSRVVDDAKGIISNLPFAKLFAGFGSNTDSKAGVMSNFTASNPREGEPFSGAELGGGFQTDVGKPVDQNFNFLGQYGGGRGLENMMTELGLSSEAEYRHYLTLSPEQQRAFLGMTPEARKGYMSTI